MQVSSTLRREEKARHCPAVAQLYLNRKEPVFPMFPASDSRGGNEIQGCFPCYSANSAPSDAK